MEIKYKRSTGYSLYIVVYSVVGALVGVVGAIAWEGLK